MEPTHSKILTFQQVRERIPFSRTHLWRLEKAGHFPRRVQVGVNRIGWVEAEVEAWLLNRMDGRHDNG